MRSRKFPLEKEDFKGKYRKKDIRNKVEKKNKKSKKNAEKKVSASRFLPGLHAYWRQNCVKNDHHFVPVSRGGTKTISICSAVHATIHALFAELILPEIYFFILELIKNPPKNYSELVFLRERCETMDLVIKNSEVIETSIIFEKIKDKIIPVEDFYLALRETWKFFFGEMNLKQVMKFLREIHSEKNINFSLDRSQIYNLRLDFGGGENKGWFEEEFLPEIPKIKRKKRKYKD